MPEKRKIKLANEEYKALNGFRLKLLTFYEDHSKEIHEEYTAELEKLRKQLYQMLKEYKDEIIAIRVKHTKAKDEELGVALPELKPLPRRRTRPGDSLQSRIIAGDDLKKDVERLPQKFQERIKREIEKLEIAKEEEIQLAKEKRNEQRDHFWKTLDKVRRSYDQKKTAIKDFDQYEETDIKTILRKYEGLVLQTRRKYIELSKLPNMDPNSNEADEFNVDNVDTLDLNIEGIASENKDLNLDTLYTEAIIQEKIKIQFNKVSNNMTRFFESYAEKKIESKCRNEGYVRMGSSSVLSYSTGLLTSDSIIYNVVYSVDVCYPYENMEINCKIKNITKIGIRAVISEHNNPIVLFISREHNPDKDFDQYKENQIIKVKVLGHRFELNDEYISVIGELI
jgi:DNA-directed RNA polymerase subunit E'/Rpb7